MSERNATAQDKQTLLGQIPASSPHRQAQPRLPAQRPRAQPSAARLWIISALVLVGVVLSFLTQIGYMGAGSSKGGHYNDVFKHGQSKGGSEGQSLKQDQAVMSGKRSVGYFVNWGIYGRKYFPQQIPSQHLTHINYAFANINKDTGEVALSDTWADVEIHYEGDSWNDEGTNLYGNFKAIYLLKKQNRNLKVLLSIGGWTYSPNFANVANPNWRAAFVHSSVKLVEDHGLDGLDIDYEYPKTPSDAQAYVDLLRELRGGLNHLAASKGRDERQYQLTVAAPCGSSNMEILHVHAMDQYLDFWNLMAYDFAGSWDPVAGHQANLYSAVPGGTSVDNAVRFYQSRGVHPSKLVVGMPLYGRAFANTDGIGAPYNGTGEGSWEAGMWDYKALPQPGAEEINDHRLGASYSYDRNKRLLISYDTQAIVTQKAQYINQNALGGVMWWELDSDKPEETGGNLVRTVREQFGQLEYRQNELEYPGSKYDNLRKGMP